MSCKTSTCTNHRAILGPSSMPWAPFGPAFKCSWATSSLLLRATRSCIRSCRGTTLFQRHLRLISRYHLAIALIPQESCFIKCKTDFQVHWGQYLLRPEFVESTYFLHRATGDPHYLEVGEEVLRRYAPQ